MGDVQRKFELTGPQIAGSALAALTAAVAASYLGVAGTVIGAALVSACTTVGTAVYTHYLARTGEKVRLHTVKTRREHPAAEPEHDGSSALVEAATGERSIPAEAAVGGRRIPAAEAVSGAPDTVGAASGRRLPWARVAVAAGLVFAISMGGILAYQTVADRTVAEQLTGGPARKAARTKPAADRDKGAEPGGPARPTRTASVLLSDRSPGPSATPAPSSVLTPAPSATPAVSSPVTPAGEPAPVPTATAPAGASPSTGAGASSSPAGGSPDEATAPHSPAPSQGLTGAAPGPPPADRTGNRTTPPCRPVTTAPGC
ncbi:hypothetical protein [Nonomuraea candida]|uniref:hypothetical protein n=1 Tax=Nonomuraea candida TaxID=359159 RepID=UPI0005BA00F2|nr:hypothetical protein [Nonomuraea candida]